MTSKNLFVLLVTAIALAVFAQTASATLGNINFLEVNGVSALGTSTVDISGFAGERIPVEVHFTALDDATDVTVSAWISGERSGSVETDRFEIFNGTLYARTLNVRLPSDIDERSFEDRVLHVSVETEDGNSVQANVNLNVQRESYLLEILSAFTQPEAKAGDTMFLDVVLKNRGGQFADDAFLKVHIPELGLETLTYFGDLSPVDQGGHDIPDEDDAVERRAFLRIPADTPAGLYTVVLEAFNDDSFTSRELRVLVIGATDDTKVVTASTTKTFGLGETVEYSLTIVNRGSVVRIYELTLTGEDALELDVDEPLIVVPAGTSRTVTITAKGNDIGRFSFVANVLSDDGELLVEKSFRAIVDDDAPSSSSSGGDSNTTVLLTVILAIIFIVLLVVLIVLLTRKPEKSEEFGESYY